MCFSMVSPSEVVSKYEGYTAVNEGCTLGAKDCTKYCPLAVTKGNTRSRHVVVNPVGVNLHLFIRRKYMRLSWLFQGYIDITLAHVIS